ncbi:methyltransferase [Corynebacterium lizhenjunii]|uniref:Methyltransferase n=1 Tax=Corynebacterium lizhenjunii TaxID=2709394 RepID=A0A7T0PAG4_9CORY|nr:methyltransferase [Corynebacterium lizhenjunii]QPK78330.1 methyltransferase [Corynebacterium lizhenjunii]
MTDFFTPLDPDHPLAEVAGDLCAVFAQAGFDAAGIAGHLGPELCEALYRGEPAAVRLGAAGDTQLDQLIRVFLLHDPCTLNQLGQLVGEDIADRLRQTGALVADAEPGGAIRVALDIRPHIIRGRTFWVFSDVDAALVDHVPGPDHVLGVGSASLSLLQSTPATPAPTVLDLGTGSGVQILGHLASYSPESATKGELPRVTATDIHPRALALAAATVHAAGVEDCVELLQGPWFEPVAGRRFDRIVANPPFVVGLPEVGHVYKDSGLNLDAASELVVSQSVEHLHPGGTAHLLAAWVHQDTQTWQQRVAGWLPDTGVAAWIIQRDVADPAQYVSTWLKDESVDVRSPAGQERTRLWLEHFARHGVTGIGFGFVAIQRIGDNEPSDILAESLTQHFEDPLGAEVEEYFTRTAWLRERDHADFAAQHFQVRPGLAREDVALPDTESGQGFSRAVLRLSRTDGPRWQHEVDEHVAAIVAGLHPQGLNLRDTVGVYAAIHGYDEQELLDAAVPIMVDLFRHGMIMPA